MAVLSFIVFVGSGYAETESPASPTKQKEYVNKSKLLTIKKNTNKREARSAVKLAVSKLERSILTLSPKLSPDYARKLAVIVVVNAQKYRLSPVLLISIMKTESSFNQRAVSSTNDVSIAQINPKVWTPGFFKEKTGGTMNLKRLRVDEAYAVSRMCLILNYYKKEFPGDPKWYARYHSSTPKLKHIYHGRLAGNARKISPLSKGILKGLPSINDLSGL